MKLYDWYTVMSKILHNYFPLDFFFFEMQSFSREHMRNELSRVQITYSFTVYKQIYKYKYVSAICNLVLFHF